MENNNLDYEARKEIMKKKTMESFTKHWEQAKQDGWRLKLVGNTELKQMIVCPPIGHESNGWGGYYFEVDEKILAPNWFADFYPVIS